MNLNIFHNLYVVWWTINFHGNLEKVRQAAFTHCLVHCLLKSTKFLKMTDIWPCGTPTIIFPRVHWSQGMSTHRNFGKNNLSKNCQIDKSLVGLTRRFDGDENKKKPDKLKSVKVTTQSSQIDNFLTTRWVLCVQNRYEVVIISWYFFLNGSFDENKFLISRGISQESEGQITFAYKTCKKMAWVICF